MPQLKIRTITNREVKYSYEQTDTVKNLKQTIQIKIGVPIDEFKLIFEARPLEDNKKLLEYNISPGCVVIMIPSITAGSC